jgi:hypothetical protein
VLAAGALLDAGAADVEAGATVLAAEPPLIAGTTEPGQVDALAIAPPVIGLQPGRVLSAPSMVSSTTRSIVHLPAFLSSYDGVNATQSRIRAYQDGNSDAVVRDGKHTLEKVAVIHRLTTAVLSSAVHHRLVPSHDEIGVVSQASYIAVCEDWKKKGQERKDSRLSSL